MLMAKKPLLRKIKKIPSKETRQEVARAHAMITMLALSLIALLLVGSYESLPFEPFLSYTASILLALVAVFSSVVAFRLRK